MADTTTTKTTKTAKKQLHAIVEPHLSAAINSANEIGITDKEFQALSATPMGYVLIYYR